MKLLVEGALNNLCNKRTHHLQSTSKSKQPSLSVGSVYIYYLFLFINAMKYMLTKLKNRKWQFKYMKILVCFFLILRKFRKKIWIIIFPLKAIISLVTLGYF